MQYMIMEGVLYKSDSQTALAKMKSVLISY